MFAYVGNQAGLAVVAYASRASDPFKPDRGSMLFEYRVFNFDHRMLMIWLGIARAVYRDSAKLGFRQSGSITPSSGARASLRKSFTLMGVEPMTRPYQPLR